MKSTLFSTLDLIPTVILGITTVELNLNLTFDLTIDLAILDLTFTLTINLVILGLTHDPLIVLNHH